MPDFSERVSGFLTIISEVFSQVWTSCVFNIDRMRIQDCDVPQRFRLRNLPGVDSIGGPAEGLTFIVTGPTR